jgi:hypothetical protein
VSSSPRFVVRENTGYRITPSGERSSRAAVEVMVIDRDYCHRVVWSSETSSVPYRRQRHGPGSLGQRIRKGFEKRVSSCREWSVERRRTYAAELCDRLNLEYEA